MDYERRSNIRMTIVFVVYICTLALMAAVIVQSMRMHSLLTQAENLADDYRQKYLETEDERKELEDDINEIFDLETQLFNSFIERDALHREAFGILQEQLEYYKQLVPEEEWHPKAEEIDKLLEIILNENPQF